MGISLSTALEESKGNSNDNAIYELHLLQRNVLRKLSLRSRRLEVAGERENGRARGRHVCPSRAPVFSCAHYFQAPATQANANSKNRRQNFT